MKARIYQDKYGYVHRTWTDYYGDTQTETYSAPSDMGYVRIVKADGSNPQVCEKLYGAGSTLMCARNNLLALIRREHHRYMRAQKAFWNI